MSFEILKDNYESPRLTYELLDCSMPASFDQYSNCGYGCVYCFSTNQRGITPGSADYFAKKVKKVSLKRFKRYFEELDNPKNKFRDLIKNRVTLQWGGLSDPLCPIEEQEGLGYEILSYLKEIKYPICFSSKSDLLLRNEKYFDLFRGMQDYWSYKASIITYDEEKAKIIEAGVPSPEARLQVLKKLSDIGIWTIIRVRPFIIGLTSLDYQKLLRTAAEYGVKAVSTEFFCLELRSLGINKAKYDLISSVLGFDVIQFYKNISVGSGYLRLNRAVKEPYYIEMRKICDETGMKFHVSDSMGKEWGDSGSCCGLPCDESGKPSLTNYSQFQFTNALQIAKKKGFVTFDDIAVLDNWSTGVTLGGNLKLGSNLKMKQYEDITIYEHVKNVWNSPNNGLSPYKYFQGVLVPEKLDENGNVVYKYNCYSKDYNKCEGCSGGCSL